MGEFDDEVRVLIESVYDNTIVDGLTLAEDIVFQARFRTGMDVSDGTPRVDEDADPLSIKAIPMDLAKREILDTFSARGVEIIETDRLFFIQASDIDNVDYLISARTMTLASGVATIIGGLPLEVRIQNGWRLVYTRADGVVETLYIKAVTTPALVFVVSTDPNTQTNPTDIVGVSLTRAEREFGVQKGDEIWHVGMKYRVHDVLVSWLNGPLDYQVLARQIKRT